MRQFSQVTLERHAAYGSSFATEPHEAGWAAEAIFFLRTESIAGPDTTMRARVQISPDGVSWLDEGTVFPTVKDVGNEFVRVTHFGGWLRLAVDLDGTDSSATVTIHLILKE